MRGARSMSVYDPPLPADYQYRSPMENDSRDTHQKKFHWRMSGKRWQRIASFHFSNPENNYFPDEWR